MSCFPFYPIQRSHQLTKLALKASLVHGIINTVFFVSFLTLVNISLSNGFIRIPLGWLIVLLLLLLLFLLLPYLADCSLYTIRIILSSLSYCYLCLMIYLAEIFADVPFAFYSFCHFDRLLPPTHTTNSLKIRRKA